MVPTRNTVWSCSPRPPGRFLRDVDPAVRSDAERFAVEPAPRLGSTRAGTRTRRRRREDSPNGCRLARRRSRRGQPRQCGGQSAPLNGRRTRRRCLPRPAVVGDLRRRFVVVFVVPCRAHDPDLRGQVEGTTRRRRHDHRPVSPVAFVLIGRCHLRRSQQQK